MDFGRSASAVLDPVLSLEAQPLPETLRAVGLDDDAAVDRIGEAAVRAGEPQRLAGRLRGLLAAGFRWLDPAVPPSSSPLTASTKDLLSLGRA